MITYDLSKADNETKTKFIADAQAIHQTTVDGNNVTVLLSKKVLHIAIIRIISVQVILFM